MTDDKTIVLQGIAASPGIVIGKAFVFLEEEFKLYKKPVPKEEIKKEITKFRLALAKTRSEMMATQEKIYKTLGKEYARLADAYLLILEDPLITKGVVKKIIDESINAEFALAKILENVIHSFEMIEDEYFRERKHDIQDVGKKILHNLLGKKKKSLAEIEAESIVVAHNLAPEDTIAIRENMVSGFVTAIGSRTSHTAIVAQGLEIPAVVGLGDILSNVNDGDTVIIDGDQGRVIVNPTPEIIENYRRQHEIQLVQIRELDKYRDLPAQTTDGHKVKLVSNIDDPQEIKSVLAHGAEGVGLYRTEFLYFNTRTLPDEEEHYRNYSDVAQRMLPYDVIIRTLDIGGDKLPSFGFTNISKEGNPFLGLRAIRLCLKYPDIFRAQLRGILRASAQGNIKIMYPMISNVSELKAANKILSETKDDLRKEGKGFDENIEVGVMIEVPSAAMTADIIAEHADFLSIGTNDLIQYTLAIDRGNTSVASLYEPYTPSILRLIKRIIDAGHEKDKWVGMCGDLASDPLFTPVLVGMGLDEFSVPPAKILKIKKIIRSVSHLNSKSLVEEVMKVSEQKDVVIKLKKYSNT